MKKLLTAIATYILFDCTFIFINHFEYFNKPKPNYAAAWYPMLKDAVTSIYYGNDSSALIIIFFFVLLIMSYFLITKAIICNSIK